MKKFLGFFLINGAAQFFLFAAMLFLSKQLGPNRFGEFSYFYAAILILHQVMDFGLSTTYVNKVAALEQGQIALMSRKLFSFRVLTIAIGTVLLLILSLWPEYLRSIANFDRRSLFIVGFGAACHLIFNVGQLSLQARKKLAEMAAGSALLNLLRLVLVFVALRETNIDPIVLIFLFFTPGLVLFFLQWYLNRDEMRSVPIQTFSELVRSGFWVMCSSLAVMLLLRLDILMLKALSGMYQVGIYSAANTVVSIFPFITSSVMMALLPNSSDMIRDLGVARYCKRAFRFAAYVIPLVVFIVAVSGWIFKIIYGDLYNESIAAFRILCVAHAFAVFINPISLVIYYKNRAYLLTLMNFVQLGINFLLNLWLIPKYGAAGAAFSTLGVYLFSSFFVAIAIVFFARQSESASV